MRHESTCLHFDTQVSNCMYLGCMCVYVFCVSVCIQANAVSVYEPSCRRLPADSMPQIACLAPVVAVFLLQPQVHHK